MMFTSDVTHCHVFTSEKLSRQPLTPTPILIQVTLNIMNELLLIYIH